MTAPASPGYSAAHRLRCGMRDDVRDALVAARDRTLAIAHAFEAALRAKDMRVPYAPALNPPLWELGHVAWFQEWWIGRNRERALGAHCDPAHERTASMQAGADAMYDSSRVPHRARWELPRPAIDETHLYLRETLARTLEELSRLPADAGDDALYFFRLVAAHEEMHAEAGLYMAEALGIATPRALLRDAAIPEVGGDMAMPAQTFPMGWSGGGFAFDNELVAHEVQLPAFLIDRAPVTWRRFLEFEEARGYDDRRWWTDAGWSWRLDRAFPRRDPAAIDLDTPACHVSAHEADAWCRWAGRRLPSEAEWECAALTQPGFAWGSVWEWTASTFEPFDGFVPHPYREYSQPWFGTRRVLKGASAQTAACMAHPRYRNFFEPQRVDVRSGFRSCAGEAAGGLVIL